VLPGVPGGAVPATKPGPNAIDRPLASARTIRSIPRAGIESRAIGHVSAQGQGLTGVPPAWVAAHARWSRRWATQALT
jgi:hypothetical protein